MADERLAQARALIKAKQYQQARKTLTGVDHPTARAWLAKLDEIAPEVPEDDPFADIVPNQPAPKLRSLAVAKVSGLESEISEIETDLRLLEDRIKDRERQRNAATIVFLFSLLLAPVGVGIVLLPFALFNYYRHKGAVNGLQKHKTALMMDIDVKRKALAQARTALY